MTGSKQGKNKGTSHDTIRQKKNFSGCFTILIVAAILFFLATRDEKPETKLTTVLDPIPLVEYNSYFATAPSGWTEYEEENQIYHPTPNAFRMWYFNFNDNGIYISGQVYGDIDYVTIADVRLNFPPGNKSKVDPHEFYYTVPLKWNFGIVSILVTAHSPSGGSLTKEFKFKIHNRFIAAGAGGGCYSSEQIQN